MIIQIDSLLSKLPRNFVANKSGVESGFLKSCPGPKIWGLVSSVEQYPLPTAAPPFLVAVPRRQPDPCGAPRAAALPVLVFGIGSAAPIPSARVGTAACRARAGGRLAMSRDWAGRAVTRRVS